MAKLLLIEGIPGSGKTTSAKHCQRILQEAGRNPHCYEEGMLHPADLAWHSIVPIEEFHRLCEDYPDYEEALLAQSQLGRQNAVIAYTKLGAHYDSDIVRRLSYYEIYNKEVPLERFKQAHFKRYRAFSKEQHTKDELYIFECAFLQNHLTELLLTYQLSDQEIFSYFEDFSKLLAPLEVMMFYLQPLDVEKSIEHVAKERINKEDPKFDWINLVVNYIKNSPYGRIQEEVTKETCLAFFERRQKLELALLPTLPFEVNIVAHKGDWDKVHKTMDYHLGKWSKK